MYTTNIIKGLNRQYRKVTKTKSVFPSDSALEKMLYLASLNVAKKWTQRYRNWVQVLNQLTVLYGERLTSICKIEASHHKESLGQRTLKRMLLSPSLFRRHLQYCRKPLFIFQRPGVGRAHEKKQSGCFISGTKNQKNLYKDVQISNTIISKINRQQNQSLNSTKYRTYLNFTGRIFLP